MRRRIQIRMACQRCRKKRAKCDGEAPCKRCVEAGEPCVYDNTRRESKDDLRAEIDRLRKCNEENDRLLRAIYAIKDVDASNSFLRHLVEGTKSRRALLQELAHVDVGINGRRPRRCVAAPESVAGASTAALEDAVCPHCLSPITTPSMHPSPSDSSEFSGYAHTSRADSTPALATPVSLASFAFDDCSNAHSDPWTRAGWSVASVRQLLDALLTWDYLPFCLVCRDPFFRDYYSGSTRYCSSALVNALLALATRVVNEDTHEAQSPGSGWSRSKAFFDEAEAILHSTGLSDNLPDIQALGILALYQITCGREAEAQELAESFAARIGELCLSEPLLGAEAEEYSKARATSYCGAVSLIRILRMTTGQGFNLSVNLVLQDDSIYLDQPSFRPSYLYASHNGTAAPDLALNARGSPLHDLQLIPARVFQLTEWVYKLLSVNHLPNGRYNLNGVMAVYTKCLDWYERFFSLLKADGSDTPFVLFIHMYYQFCLLCLFRSFSNMVLAESDIQPRDICLQAAQSILVLSQSYNRLFTLRRVSAFVPYFVCASGLAGLMLDPPCDDHPTALPHSIPPSKLSLKSESDSDMDGYGLYQSGPPSPTAGKMPIVSLASHLLAEMSSNHRVTSSAEKMLQGELN
ncbi:hypothetical protein HIM_12234 [Hirsutella minnesotensis 3608]|uniref:Zn(2)-C6 fungal-type domain-containing protein n=1 Tax=Hirsutella minnesotensis 3608 TaxID=1043627 RepID=A0A0F8A0A8_9HYPO|nr:hypothetical protein HIM_12234 [Hirsutella minnesotensis 3608]